MGDPTPSDKALDSVGSTPGSLVHDCGGDKHILDKSKLCRVSIHVFVGESILEKHIKFQK